MLNCDDFWIEKFRPKTLGDLCISKETREIIEGYGKNIPNLLFTGGAGMGKTSLARIIVTDILKCDYLYINASDENGIDTVRDKISGFAQTKSFDGELKVIILDEIDGFSKPAQNAMRNIMEEYAATTRFILTGNYKHKISTPLQSRCQSLEIRPSIRDCISRCLYILKLEKIEVSPEQRKLLARLVKSNFPDLRKCINETQKHCRNGKINLLQKIDNDDVCEIIYQNILSGKSLETRKYLIENEELFGGAWEQLLVDLLNHVYRSTTEDSTKKGMIMTIADHLDKSTRVNDQEINFFACILNLE